MSQKTVVLGLLRQGPVCSFEFYRTYGLTHRLAARIHDLRREGHVITSEPCKVWSHHHKAPAVEYRLVEPGQGALPF